MCESSLKVLCGLCDGLGHQLFSREHIPQLQDTILHQSCGHGEKKTSATLVNMSAATKNMTKGTCTFYKQTDIHLWTKQNAEKKRPASLPVAISLPSLLKAITFTLPPKVFDVPNSGNQRMSSKDAFEICSTLDICTVQFVLQKVHSN